jgi:hypothetical protein
MPEPDRYAAERYDATLAHCHALSLMFDGSGLTLFESGRLLKTYPAVSGKPIAGKGGSTSFNYSRARQKLGGAGPIPEGGYWVNPQELWENAWYKNGSRGAWGNYRLTIHPFTTTTTHGRGGFFLHGGTTPGSAGCIDLTSAMDLFVAELKKRLGSSRDCQIHINVDYRMQKDG